MTAPESDGTPLKRLEFPPIPDPSPLPPSGSPPFALPLQAYTVEPLVPVAAFPPAPALVTPPGLNLGPVAPLHPVPPSVTPPSPSPGPVAPLHPVPPSVAPPSPKTAAALVVPFLVACLVAAGLGVYGKLHEPTGIAVNVAGFSSPATVKVWLATLAFVLALFQLFTALVMYGKLAVLSNAAWLGPAHRWSGRLAFLASIPVALHCLYALGFADYDTRVLLHSLLGCFFYGTFAAKMLILAKKGVPAWALPLFGGLVFTALSGLFVTSALWFFTTFGVKL